MSELQQTLWFRAMIYMSILTKICKIFKFWLLLTLSDIQVLTLTWTYGRAMKLIQPLQLLKMETWWYNFYKDFWLSLSADLSPPQTKIVLFHLYTIKMDLEKVTIQQSIWVLFNNFPEMLNDTEPHIIGNCTSVVDLHTVPSIKPNLYFYRLTCLQTFAKFWPTLTSGDL